MLLVYIAIEDVDAAGVQEFCAINIKSTSFL